MSQFIDIVGGTPPGTQQKLNILARKYRFSNQKPVSTSIKKMFETAENSYQETQFDKYTQNVVKTLFSQEIALGRSLQKGTDSFGRGLDRISNAVAGELYNLNINFDRFLKPVSTALGSTLGTLTGILRDPLGSISLIPSTVLSIIEGISPKFAATLEGHFKSTKLQNLAHIPGQVLGSIRNLVTVADAVITLPIIILSDLYNGLLDIMQEISDFVNEIISMVTKFIMNKIYGLLNAIIPIDAILEFLDAVIELSAEIQGLSAMFLGNNIVTQYSSMVLNYAVTTQRYLLNPIQALYAYLPQSFTQNVNKGLYFLRNPEQFVNSLLPPEITGMLDKVLTPITGFGFNGNMGYGLSSTLNGLRGGVISSILKGYSNQYPMLKPLLGQIGAKPPVSYPPTLTRSVVNPKVPVVQGIPQMQEIPQDVIEQDKASLEQDKAFLQESYQRDVDKAFLQESYQQDAMLADPVGFIRGG